MTKRQIVLLAGDKMPDGYKSCGYKNCFEEQCKGNCTFPEPINPMKETEQTPEEKKEVESSEPQENGFIAIPNVLTEKNAIISRAITWLSEDESPRAKEIIHQLSSIMDVSAPSESQEEMWRDFQWRLLCDGKVNVAIELLKDIGKHFTITRNP